MVTDLSPLLISIKTTFIATIITSILGIFMAYTVTNLNNKLKIILDVIFTVSIVLPPTVIGFFLLLILGKNSIIGSFFISMDKNIIFSWSATVISAIVVSFPIMYRSARSTFEQIDENIIYVAKTLGLSNIKIFIKIIFPISIPGLIGGVILSFTRALGEFGATLMIAGNIPGKTQTMPLAIFFAVESGHMDIAFMWVLFIMLISFSTIFILNTLSQHYKKTIGQRSN